MEPAADSPDVVQSEPTAFHLVALVWGDEYTGLFLDLALPSLLSPGNIPALTAVGPVVLKLYTRAVDIPRFGTHPAVKGLRALGEVRFEVIDHWLDPSKDKYALMTACHKAAVREAGTAGAALVFLVSDAVQADGSLAAVVRAVRAGKRAVMQPGVRVIRERAAPYLYERYARVPGAPISIPARDLVRLALTHMHPLCRTCYWDSDDFTPNPVTVYWRADEMGFVLRGFHHHPLLIFPEHPAVDFLSTLDDDLVLLACPDYDAFHVVDDSDEAFFVDLTDGRWEGHRRPAWARPNSVRRLRRKSGEFANLHHRRFFMHATRVHAGEISVAMDRAKRESARVVRWLSFGWQVDRIKNRLLGRVTGLSEGQLLERSIEQGLSWRILPPPGRLWRTGTQVLRWLGAKRAACRFERLRRIAFATQASWVFGVRLAARGLRLRTELRERLRKREMRERLRIGKRGKSRQLRNRIRQHVGQALKRYGRLRRHLRHRAEVRREKIARRTRWYRKHVRSRGNRVAWTLVKRSRRLVSRSGRQAREAARVARTSWRHLRKGAKRVRWAVGTTRRFFWKGAKHVRWAVGTTRRMLWRRSQP